MDLFLHRLPIKLESKVKFYGYETMKSNLNKENFRNSFRNRDLYSCRIED